MGTLIKTFIVVLVLLGVFFVLKSMSRTAPRSRTFSGPSFGKIRREVNKGELVRDPVSGTYVSKDDAVRRTIGGEVYYFSSEENAEAFEKEKRA